MKHGVFLILYSVLTYLPCGEESFQFFSMPLQKTATWIQSPFMSFPAKHRTKNEEIHRIFQELPEEEKLIDGRVAHMGYTIIIYSVDYSCALQREILLQGRLYITQNWLCFYANIFTWVTLVRINAS